MSNIAIINTMPIPSGAASVNRILSYSKGLAELGDSITILSSAHSVYPKGNICGVKYDCMGEGADFVSLSKTLLKIMKRVWYDRFEVVILVTNSLLLLYPIFLTCRIRGIKIVQEKSEFPFVLMKKGIINKIWAKFYTSTTYKLFDGIIVMTKPLKDYFSNKVRSECKLIEVPMTVDIDRFSLNKNLSPFGNYIAYCGDMTGNKDGVNNLIQAFSIAAKSLFDVKLLLIGKSANEEEYKQLKDLAQEKCNDRIIFYGFATRESIPQLLTDAKALALARPSCLQSTGGFPTKLGEYLATGNPVIVTAVGDIPLYLNSSNSFIVEPDNNDAFASKIVEVFDNYTMAKIVGKKGKEVVEKIFSYKVQSPHIHNFLLELCK